MKVFVPIVLVVILLSLTAFLLISEKRDLLASVAFTNPQNEAFQIGDFFLDSNQKTFSLIGVVQSSQVADDGSIMAQVDVAGEEPINLQLGHLNSIRTLLVKKQRVVTAFPQSSDYKSVAVSGSEIANEMKSVAGKPVILTFLLHPIDEAAIPESEMKAFQQTLFCNRELVHSYQKDKSSTCLPYVSSVSVYEPF